MSFKQVSILLCLLSTIFLLSANRAFGQSDGTIPFTPASIRSIVGRNICDFHGEFRYTGGVYLDFAKTYSVDYRERDGIAGVFLLNRPTLVFRSGKPTLSCGLVDAALDLTRLIRKSEDVEFKCYTAHFGGTTWGKWGYVVGLADNDNGLKRFVRARRAWKVDVLERRFEELKGQPVTCDTTGYDD